MESHGFKTLSPAASDGGRILLKTQRGATNREAKRNVKEGDYIQSMYSKLECKSKIGNIILNSIKCLRGT